MIRRIGLFFVELCVILILVISAVLFWASYYIDTDEFRATFVSFCQETTGRNAVLEGELNIDLWPSLALEVTDLVLMESPRFGTGEFARLGRIEVSIDVLPLMGKIIDVESVEIEGGKLNLIYTDDGRFNLPTLLMDQASSSEGTPLMLDGWELFVGDVELIGADIRLTDMMDQSTYTLTGINLRTGDIEPGEDVPFSVSSSFAWEEQGIKSSIRLQGALALADNDLGASLKDATLYASFTGDFLPDGAKPGEVTAQVAIDWNARTVALQKVQASLLGMRADGFVKSGNLNKPFEAAGQVTVHPFSPKDIIARFIPDTPAKRVDGLRSCSFTSSFTVNESGGSLENLAFALDDLTVRGDIDFKGFSRPVLDFSLRGDNLDIDKYIPLTETATPFIWDDFDLDVYSFFLGKGTARLDGLKLFDTNIANIHASANASNDLITVEAKGATMDDVALTGKLEAAIGESSQSGVPTFGAKLHMEGVSEAWGFSQLKGDTVSVEGAGIATLDLVVSPMACPSDARSIAFLHNLTGTASLNLSNGLVTYKEDAKEPFVLDFAKAQAAIKVRPAKGSTFDVWKRQVEVSLKTQGGTEYQTTSVSFDGPLEIGVEDFNISTGGAAVKAHFSASQLPRKARRITGNGVLGFDLDAAKLALENVYLRGVDTTLRGNIALTNLDKSFKGKGSLEISEANPKRIVYLLSDYSIETEDAEALKKASLSTKFEIDSTGFTLSKLDANLDGMDINGHVVGQGYSNPNLSFSLAAGAFDLDRYLPPSTEPSIDDVRSGKHWKAPPVDLPLDFLRSLKLNGKAYFEEFKLAKIRTRSLTGSIKANKGAIHVSDIRGKMYSGVMNAEWNGNVWENELSSRLKMHVEDMHSGRLMTDLAEREYLRGVTDLEFDLESKGATDDDILKNLKGKAWVVIRNGSFKFTGWDVKPSSFSGRQEQKIAKAEERRKARTVFRKAEGRFDVMNGVFSIQKLAMDSTLVTTKGRGGFSLPDNSIDVSLKNDLVAVPSIVIEIKGRLTDPEVNIPTGRIVDSTVRNILSLPEKSFKFLRDLF